METKRNKIFKLILKIMLIIIFIFFIFYDLAMSNNNFPVLSFSYFVLFIIYRLMRTFLRI